MAYRWAASSTGWTTAPWRPRSRRGALFDPAMSAEALAALAVALGAGWASGLNAYAAVLVLAAILFALNFLADKIPYVDSINDMLHTFVRVPAGALLAYGAATGISPEVAVIAGLLGGTLAAGTHIAKTGSRALINTSPEPFSNIAASLTEDATVIGGLALAITHPITFLCLLALFVALLVWLLPKLLRL